MSVSEILALPDLLLTSSASNLKKGDIKKVTTGSMLEKVAANVAVV
uniref:Uncharacterized protein n=1 Tax=Arundo donax TaxID=35708 RepID=A0A0A9I3H0_ARUDO